LRHFYFVAGNRFFLFDRQSGRIDRRGSSLLGTFELVAVLEPTVPTFRAAHCATVNTNRAIGNDVTRGAGRASNDHGYLSL
jgi:hypothetical protein